MGNFELACSLYRHQGVVCSWKTFSPSTPNPRNTVSPPHILTSPRNRRVSATRRVDVVRSGNLRSDKGQLYLSSLSRPWSDYFALFRYLAVGVFGTAALLSQGFAHADAGSVKADTPLRYPCEDVARYYGGTEGLEGAALTRRLYSIVSDQQSLPYKKVWDALKILDAADTDNPEDSTEIIEIYSLRSVPKALAGKLEGWNREHLWPRSYGLLNHPSLTDLHNIRPADVNVNSSRGNKYFGECVSGSIGCVQPAYREAALDTEADKESWTPPSQVRGDVARSLMYMAVRYGFDGSLHLMLSDSPSARNREMGLLSTLLKWNEVDPPSREEKLRNDLICHLYQHNRNPFIDHPEYANMIWKQHAAPSGQSGEKPPLKALTNEFHYNNKRKDENELLEIVVASSMDTNKLHALLYNSTNGKVIKFPHLRDTDMGVISTTSDGSDSSWYSFHTTFVQLQNGHADGIALVLFTSTSPQGDNQSQVIQFISYWGTV